MIVAFFQTLSCLVVSRENRYCTRLPIRVKLRIFQSVVVSTLIYSLDSLTMLPKHFTSLNSIYFRLLRRVVWGESSIYFACLKYYSLGTSRAPHNTSPTNSPTANQIFIDMLGYCAERPFPSHCVLFQPWETESNATKKSSRGRPPPHWLSLMLDYLQLPINHFFPHHPQITNPMTLQQLINKTPRLTGFLVAAPTCASLFPFLQLARPEQQRAGHG